MRFIIIFWWILFLPSIVASQENSAINELLLEAESKLYFQPEQSGKISNYIIGQNESAHVQVEAKLLLSKSFYIRGNFNDAIKNALEAKDLADASGEDLLRIKSTSFAMKVLRELGLTRIADDYLKELKSFSKNKLGDRDFSDWLSAKLMQDSAFISFHQDKFLEAKQLQQKAKELFSNIKDTIAIRAADISIAEIDIILGEFDQAKMILERNIKTENTFQKLHSLSLLGQIYFNEKNYEQGLEYFQQALLLSEELPNKYYQQKSLEGLTVTYLALENTSKFNIYKQRTTLTSTEVETDKNTAVNSVYNYINTRQKKLAENKIQNAYFRLYALLTLFVLLLLIGLILNYWYLSRQKEFTALWKYLQPGETVEIVEEEKEPIRKTTGIPEETERIILQKLINFEKGTKFTNPDMSIAFLASKFETNTKYLSEIINRHKGKNFNSYINELRINYIIEKLKSDPIYFSYKISYLAEESGFSSHSSFATVFKSVTGISPTRFMELLQKRKETI